ncbi:adhesion G protein-coupled receptor L4-like [Antedon mediterranea]|uniref:adhesion G protein-coupled receptor L4-like n=1 Tax=Antedon mediterranea TaxID=105859 RepID=UPI003AF47E9B
MLLWNMYTFICHIIFVFTVYTIVKSDKTEGYVTDSIFSENLPVSISGRTCTSNEGPKGATYRCQHERADDKTASPDAYLDVLSMASIADADVVATLNRPSEIQGYRSIQRNSDDEHSNDHIVNYELVSDVLTCSVYQNHTVRSAEVTFSIKLEQSLNEQNGNADFVRKNALCVFWDSSARRWSTWGCKRDFGDSSSSYITCNCNHTTSFAIIAPMEKYDPLGKKAIGIRVPTYAACLISIIVQSIVIWHIVKLRHLVKDYDYVFTLLNLLAASIATTATLVCSIEFSRFIIPCTVSGIVMHFFYTATLAWFAAEGAHYYLKIMGKTIEEGYTNKRYYSAFGWALPAALVGIFVGVHRGYGKHDRCLLTAYSGILPAFIFSAVLFLTVKSILLLVAMRGYKEDSRPVKYKNVFVKIRRCVVESVFMIPYLGVIWVFGMTSHITYELQVLFYVLFALQGFFISIYCYFTKEIELARSRSTRQGLMRLRSLSHQGLVFGRVPLEEVGSPDEPAGDVELTEVNKQEKQDNQKKTGSRENIAEDTDNIVHLADGETAAGDVSEAEINEVQVVLLKAKTSEENLSDNEH